MRLPLITCLGLTTLALSAAACEGGQTGDLSGDHDLGGKETGNSSGCDEHRKLLAGFDAATDAGTAEELLAYAEKSFDSPITWKVAPSGQSWTLAPESGAGALSIEVTRGAKAYELSYSPHQDSDGSGASLDIGVICPPPQLGVEAHVSVTTEGGALAESYDTLLRSSTPGVATLSVPFDPKKLKGSLKVSSSNANAKLVQLSLNATFTAGGMTGLLAGLEQEEHGKGPNSATSAMGAVLAVWPDSMACQASSSDGDGLAVTLAAETLGATGTATLATVTPTADESITWLDGTTTTLSVKIESKGDGCFRVRDELPLELDGGPSVSYPVTITLKSADGRLDGSYDGEVLATGAGERRRVTANAFVTVQVDDFAKTGFKSVKVPDGTASLSFQVESQFVRGAASGSVNLFAMSAVTPCEQAEDNAEKAAPPSDSGNGSGMSSSGCAGQSQTRLENAYWTE